MTDRCQQQLTNLNDAFEERRPYTGQGRRKVILLHDDARPHVAKATVDHIFALGWELLPHAEYSPDMAPYYLFRSLQHHLADTHFVRFEEVRKCIDDFIASKPVSFIKEFANYSKDAKRSLMQTGNISVIIICLFLLE